MPCIYDLLLESIVQNIIIKSPQGSIAINQVDGFYVYDYSSCSISRSRSTSSSNKGCRINSNNGAGVGDGIGVVMLVIVPVVLTLVEKYVLRSLSLSPTLKRFVFTFLTSELIQS